MEALPNFQKVNYQENTEQEMLRGEIYGKPPAVRATFYIGALKDMETSTEECPIYIEKVFVALQVTGDKDFITSTKNKDHEKQFPREWELFLKLKDIHPIPLTSLPQMRPSVLEAFTELGIRCISDVIEKPLPEYLQKYKKWATYIQSIHDMADGKPKLRVVA